MKRSLLVTIVITWILGFGTLGDAAYVFLRSRPFETQAEALFFSVLLVLAIIAEMKPVPYTLGRAGKEESLTIAIVLLVLFSFGWSLAVFVAGISVLTADIIANRVYYKALFNFSMYILAAAAAGVSYDALHYLSPTALPPSILMEILARFAAGWTYYLVNLSLLMAVLSKVQSVPVLRMIIWGFRDSVMVNLALVSLAVGMSLLWQLHPLAAVVLIPPLFMAKMGYEAYTRLRTEAEDMLATLADLLDQRDDVTGQHSRRVAEMCYDVARLLGLPEDEALAIRAIARVHDIGKIAVRDDILLKPGPLTPGELKMMQAHVEVGARILSHLTVYTPHLSILLQHHERLDGRGYPHGVSGEEIHIGARILAACDAFDTMTSDRPYRRRIPEQDALAELYDHVGTQFDPKVVEALETWLIHKRRIRPDWRAQWVPSLSFLDASLAGEGRRLSKVETYRPRDEPSVRLP
ncbi:MAG: HD-GYP domain-containing protein [Armatimonadota bacterium]|nr:HD-GYP domain-containing protein [Armatimonadota bacterium]